MQDQYKLELWGNSLEILADNDSDAIYTAKKYLIDSGIKSKGLKLFRYPKEWANKSVDMVEVMFYY